MSKYSKLWQHVAKTLKENGQNSLTLTFNQIEECLGFKIDHSFLNCKKEALNYGVVVTKISLKMSNVTFERV